MFPYNRGQIVEILCLKYDGVNELTELLVDFSAAFHFRLRDVRSL